MGAILVCFGDYEPDFCDIRQRRERSPCENSLIDRFQKKWGCGRLNDEFEDPFNWDAFLLQSNRTTASSGSRMLSAFYNRLLIENDDGAFYFDSRGKRLKGAYLDRVEWLDDYFMPGGRRRALLIAPSSPPLKSLERYSSSEDCFSTTSTIMSDLDYWATSDPLFLLKDHGHNLPPRPCLGRCLSLGSVETEHKMHRTSTSLYKQEDFCSTHSQPSWDSSRPRLSQFSSPQPFLGLTIVAS